MKITFLGTGTSHGVPKIACSCEVCISENRKNKRLRSSILVEDEYIAENKLLIDTSIDFRQQALAYGIKFITDILITHIHADHIFGLDDMRVFNKLTGGSLNLYLNADFNKKIRHIFPYMYKKLFQQGGGVTQVKNTVLKPYGKYLIKNYEITPIPVLHGKLQIFGYRINNAAYITDASYIPERSIEYLKGVDVLILNALRYKKHSTHFTIPEAISISQKIKPAKTYFTHICHEIEHEKVNADLPENTELAYDGLVINI
ncbi:MAG: MBL fold metallo-hydrolase [Spirochaetes bacterium]|nr:MBL fold metallo-hydrolase [Spirochaetota bacterium]